MCVGSFSYPAFNGHAPYCRLWPSVLCNLFPHSLTNGTILGGGGVPEQKMGFLFFFYFFVVKIFFFKKN